MPFNALVGHHGIFSLTPIWLLSVAGTVRLGPADSAIGGCAIWQSWWESGDPGLPGVLSFPAPGASQLRRHEQRVAVDVLVVAAVARGDVPGRRCPPHAAGLGPSLGLLGISVLSVNYPTWNPWTHPWIADYMKWLGVGG